MATCATMLADLNDRLNDAGNSQATEARKIAWLNDGIRATFPRLYMTARDQTIEIVADTYEYNIPAAVGNNTRIVRIETETGDASGRFVDIFDADVVPGLTDPVLVFRNELPPVGARVRITAAKPITEFAASGDTYVGPAGTEELPVLYAMGIATGRRLDDRIDHRRYSTTQAANGVTTADMMDVSQLFFAQFELLLERKAMPLPAQQG